MAIMSTHGLLLIVCHNQIERVFIDSNQQWRVLDIWSFIREAEWYCIVWQL